LHRRWKAYITSRHEIRWARTVSQDLVTLSWCSMVIRSWKNQSDNLAMIFVLRINSRVMENRNQTTVSSTFGAIFGFETKSGGADRSDIGIFKRNLFPIACLANSKVSSWTRRPISCAEIREGNLGLRKIECHLYFLRQKEGQSFIVPCFRVTVEEVISYIVANHISTDPNVAFQASPGSNTAVNRGINLPAKCSGPLQSVFSSWYRVFFLKWVMKEATRCEFSFGSRGPRINKDESHLWHKTRWLISRLNGRLLSVIICENVARRTAYHDGTFLERVCWWNQQLLPNKSELLGILRRANRRHSCVG
jgi:hypothetical protein